MGKRKRFNFKKVTDEDRAEIAPWLKEDMRELLTKQQRLRQDLVTVQCRIGVVQAMAADVRDPR